MPRVKLTNRTYPQLTAPTGTASTLAALMSLSTDAECLHSTIVVQADDANSGEVFIGGDTVTETQGIKLAATVGVSFQADDGTEDGTNSFYDLREIKIFAVSSGQKVNVMTSTTTEMSYNR